MKIQTSDLIDSALDWAVAKCAGYESRCPWMLEKHGYVSWQSYERAWGNPLPSYSTDWSQGGQIIGREKIATQFWISESSWEGSINGGFFASPGPTPLVAAMRCYVASKLGNEVDVPNELVA